MVNYKWHAWRIGDSIGVNFYMSTGESNRIASQSIFQYWWHYDVWYVAGRSDGRARTAYVVHVRMWGGRGK